MTDTELITAIHTAVKEELKETKEEIVKINSRLDNHDKRFDQIDKNINFLASEVSEIKQNQNRFERKLDLIGTRQVQQFKFLST